MLTFTKTLIGTISAGVMAATAATPALARDYDRGHHRGMNADRAVQRCAAAATRTASRYSYGSRARVTDIRDVDRKRYGYKVEGRIAVNTMHRGWREARHSYGWNRGVRGYDSGRFVCKVDYRGRIADLDFSGIRGL
ncbi:hypothetical protein [Novosphingobium album (ex Hu et al. 2023)]|uniref:Uncharacterized protein n=1 Tax=Novosphingobium album (ex Hu et al. 2023) TaxID=2930093 RepID=A0ABT0B5M8_9SPHN|nr:hypothetical protein [Novosphingobium album (ex Hu et al. 2023)]MCJ2180366.1 hypothetical protein [Novosphingobium album (ex Hu et al. 2023)]